MKMRIPEDTVTPEEFTAIRVRLRMFFGVPAEIIPDTHEKLCADLCNDRLLQVLHRWLVGRGYEVVRDYSDSLPRYLIIRPDAIDALFGAEAVAQKIKDDIDKRVINALLGETP